MAHSRYPRITHSKSIEQVFDFLLFALLELTKKNAKSKSSRWQKLVTKIIFFWSIYVTWIIQSSLCISIQYQHRYMLELLETLPGTSSVNKSLQIIHQQSLVIGHNLNTKNSQSHGEISDSITSQQHQHTSRAWRELNYRKWKYQVKSRTPKENRSAVLRRARTLTDVETVETESRIERFFGDFYNRRRSRMPGWDYRRSAFGEFQHHEGSRYICL